MIFHGKAKDLQFVPDNKIAWLNYLEQNDKKTLLVRIDRETGIRSSNQNNYLWGVVYKVIAEHTGYTENDIHEIMKRKFLPPDFITWKGQEIKIPGSTAKLDKGDSFPEYIERIRAEVASLGIIIPEPIK